MCPESISKRDRFIDRRSRLLFPATTTHPYTQSYSLFVPQRDPVCFLIPCALLAPLLQYKSTDPVKVLDWQSNPKTSTDLKGSFYQKHPQPFQYFSRFRVKGIVRSQRLSAPRSRSRPSINQFSACDARVLDIEILPTNTPTTIAADYQKL